MQSIDKSLCITRYISKYLLHSLLITLFLSASSLSVVSIFINPTTNVILSCMSLCMHLLIYVSKHFISLGLLVLLEAQIYHNFYRSGIYRSF